MLVAFIDMDGKCNVDLWRWKREQAHDFESVSNDADSHELLAVIAAVHHEGVGETFNYGAVGLAEALDGITASGVRDVDGGADLDVVTVGEGRQPELLYASLSKLRSQERSIQAHSRAPAIFCRCKLQTPGRVLTSMRCLELQRPRMTTC